MASCTLIIARHQNLFRLLPSREPPLAVDYRLPISYTIPDSPYKLMALLILFLSELTQGSLIFMLAFISRVIICIASLLPLQNPFLQGKYAGNIVDTIPGLSIQQANPQNFSQCIRQQIMKSVVDFGSLVYE